MQLSGVGRSESARPARRLAFGLVAALVVVGAAALAGSVVGKQDPAAAAAAGVKSEPTMAYRMWVDGIDPGTSDGGMDLSSFSWGETLPVSSTGGGGGATGRVDMTDLTVTKEMDKASTHFMEFCANGRHIKDVRVQIELIDSKGSKTHYMSIELENVIITSYSVGGSAGEPLPTETISLNFEKVTWKYTGDGSSGDDMFSWDLSTNQS